MPRREKEWLRQSVQDSLEAALTKTEFARDWRNRHIAHKDLRLALADGAEPLKAASRTAVKEALGAIADVLNTISGSYLNSTTMFEGLGAQSGAETLLHVLDDGLTADQERRDRLRKGEFRPDDYARRDL